MQKYYVVTPESQLCAEYWNYKGSLPVTRAIVKSFMESQGMEGDEYYASHDGFYFVPTAKDMELFGSQLSSEVHGEGLRRFKANGKVHKEWKKTLKEANHRIVPKPRVFFYFERIGGRSLSQLFDVDDVVYCSFEQACDFDNPAHFQEIKGSEFHKIIEDAKEAAHE